MTDSSDLSAPALGTAETPQAEGRCSKCGGEWVHLHDEDRIDHTRSWWQCRDCDQLRAQARRK